MTVFWVVCAHFFFLKPFYNTPYENRYFLTPEICLKNNSEQIANHISVICILSLSPQKSQRAKSKLHLHSNRFNLNQHSPDVAKNYNIVLLFLFVNKNSIKIIYLAPSFYKNKKFFGGPGGGFTKKPPGKKINHLAPYLIVHRFRRVL